MRAGGGMAIACMHAHVRMVLCCSYLYIYIFADPGMAFTSVLASDFCWLLGLVVCLELRVEDALGPSPRAALTCLYYG